MRNVWIALAVIVAGSLLGAFLLWRTLDTNSPARPLVGPRGAQLVQEHPLGTRRIVVWRIGGHAEEPASGLYGVTIWQGKHRLYEQRAAPGTTGIRIETGDFGRDRRSDVVLYEDHGACGLYRAIVTGVDSAGQLFSRWLCANRGSVHIRKGAFVIRVGERTTEVRS
jgi:hypothetical protein